MLSNRFTVLELIDLALLIPEVGAVNFNYLHTVLTYLAKDQKVDEHKLECYIEDEVTAQAAITEGRMLHAQTKRQERLRPIKSLTDMKATFQKPIDEPPEIGSTESFEDKKKLGKKHKSTGKPIDEPPEIGSTESFEDKKKKGTKHTSTQKPIDELPEIGSTESVEDKKKKGKKHTSTGKPIDEPPEIGSTESFEDKKKKGKKHTSTRKPIDESPEIGSTETSESKKSEPGAEVSDITEPKKKESKEKTTEEPKEVNAEEKKGKLKIPPRDLTRQNKNLGEISDKQKADEVKEDEKDIARRKSAEEMVDGTEDEAGQTFVTKALKDSEEGVSENDPKGIVQELWEAVQIISRIRTNEWGLEQATKEIDKFAEELEGVKKDMKKNKSLSERIRAFFDRFDKLEDKCEKLSVGLNEMRTFSEEEINRLEKIIKGLETDVNNLLAKQKESDSALNVLSATLDSLLEKVVYKEDLGQFETQMSERVVDLNKKLMQLQDTVVLKEDFTELASRVDTLEDTKVSREELGRFMEPGFIDNFIMGQEVLKGNLDTVRQSVSKLGDQITALETRIDEDILKNIEASFGEIKSIINTMKEKLDTLDADDINDTFVDLEEKNEKLAKQMDSVRAAGERFELEARVNFKKILSISAQLFRLESTKVDKTKMYELLELKADLEMVNNKLDKDEFQNVMKEVEEKAERTTIQVKINEAEIKDNFRHVRRDLSFKMYTEDFVVSTEPIRNRIKAMLYEQKRLKDMIVQSFLPEAPGVATCFSCNRVANLPGPPFQGATEPKLIEETPSTSIGNNGVEKESKGLGLPPTDLDSVPIPPADHPRTQNVHELEVILASARPRVGLLREKRKSVIDKELEDLFSADRLLGVGGPYTRTLPQQRGVSFTTMALPPIKKTEITCTGRNSSVFKGAIYGNLNRGPNSSNEQQWKNLRNTSSTAKFNTKIPLPPIKPKQG